MQHAWIDLAISLTFSCLMQTHGHLNATIALHGHTIWSHSSVKKLGLVGLARLQQRHEQARSNFTTMGEWSPLTAVAGTGNSNRLQRVSTGEGQKTIEVERSLGSGRLEDDCRIEIVTARPGS
jgi:hypothetical protein